ncbi:unnamed protein product [Closterium sp. NIES-54]
MGVDVYALDFAQINDAIYAMYVTEISAEGACYSCVPCDAGVEAVALGASESATALVASESTTALGASESAASAEALHTFTLDSGTSRCFFRDCTIVTPLATLVLVSRADPSGSPVVARASTVLPCPAVPAGSLLGLHLPSFSTNLVSNAVLQDALVSTFAPGGERVTICTDCRTSEHLATFTRRPGSSLYTLTTESAQEAESGQTQRWHHRLGHPSQQRLRSMHYRLLISGLLRSLPPLPRSLAPPCPPCVEGQQRAAPHSSEFPLTTAPLQTLHMDIRATRRQLHERFQRDLLVLRLHSDRGGEFSSSLLEEFCLAEGIRQTFTLLASPQQNGIAECCIGLITELNLWPRVSVPETSPTLRWTGKVGDVSVFRVWGALSLVCNIKASKLSPHTLRCVFLGFSIDAPPWQFYHPCEHRVFSSQDVTFDEYICFYRLHPHASHPVPLTPLFLVPVPPRVDPLPPQGPAPSGLSQVDPPPLDEPVEISSDSSGPAEVDDPAADETVTTRRSPRLETPPSFPPRASSLPLQPSDVDSCATAGGDTGGAESGDAATGGPGVGQPQQPGLHETRSPQWLREWILQRGRPSGGGYGPAGTGGTAGAGGAGAVSLGGPTRGVAGAGGTRGAAAAGAGGTGGATGAGGAGAATTGGAAGAGGTGGTAGAGGARAASPGGPTRGAAGAGDGGTGGATGARGAGAASLGGATSARGAGAATTGGAAGAGGAASAGGAGGAAGAGGTGAAAGSAGGPAGGPAGAGPACALGHLLGLLPAPTEFPVAEPETRASTHEHRETKTRASVPVRVRCVPRPCALAVPDTHDMTLHPSSVPQRVVLPSRLASSLPHVADPPSDLGRAASPTVTRFLAMCVTDPTFSSPATSAFVAELVDFPATYRLDYLASLVSNPIPACPPSVGGELALGCDVLEDRQEELECLAAAAPHLATMLLAPKGDPDALDIPTPRSYREAISDKYSSQWQTAMEAEMAS